MPIVTITVRRHRSAEFKARMLAAIHAALVDAGANPNDRFHRVLELGDDDFQFDPTFPDVRTRRTDDFVLVEILLGTGRSVKVKKQVLAGIFVVILAMMALATAASVIAFTGLSLILLLPFVWLAAIPLQLAAFLLRALVFQYIDITSIAAYLQLYRAHSHREAAAGVRGAPVPAWPPPADLTNQ
jgi:hypothetical protein